MSGPLVATAAVDPVTTGLHRQLDVAAGRSAATSCGRAMSKTPSPELVDARTGRVSPSRRWLGSGRVHAHAGRQTGARMVPAADRPVTGTGVERHSPHPGVELLALRIDQARPGKRPDHDDQPPKIITASPINARPPIPLPRSTVPPDSAVQPTLCKPDRPETPG